MTKVKGVNQLPTKLVKRVQTVLKWLNQPITLNMTFQIKLKRSINYSSHLIIKGSGTVNRTQPKMDQTKRLGRRFSLRFNNFANATVDIIRPQKRKTIFGE